VTTHHTLPSYRPCTLCNPSVDCAHAEQSTPEQPCWGEVMIEVEDHDNGHIHTCRGHEAIWLSPPFYRDYVPEGESIHAASPV
jgi:hypothetical protein